MNYLSLLKQSMENIRLLIKAVSKIPTSTNCSKAVLSVLEAEVLFRVDAQVPHLVPYAVAFVAFVGLISE